MSGNRGDGEMPNAEPDCCADRSLGYIWLVSCARTISARGRLATRYHPVWPRLARDPLFAGADEPTRPVLLGPPACAARPFFRRLPGDGRITVVARHPTGSGQGPLGQRRAGGRCSPTVS